MKILENITSTTITILLSALSGLVGILLGSIYSEVVPIIRPTLIQQVPITVWLRILLVVLIALALSIALSYFIYRKFKPTLTPRFGVLWDKNKEPHCPSCKTYLSGYTELPKAFYFRCHGHDKIKDVYMHNDGVPISLRDARKLL